MHSCVNACVCADATMLVCLYAWVHARTCAPGEGMYRTDGMDGFTAYFNYSHSLEHAYPYLRIAYVLLLLLLRGPASFPIYAFVFGMHLPAGW